MTYTGPVIDTDVHYVPRSQDDWLPYLAKEWRDYIESPGGGRRVPVYSALAAVAAGKDGFYRMDAWAPDEAEPGSDYGLMREQYLDRFDLRAALLSYVSVPSSTNGDLVGAVCRALNDWCAAEWLDGRDDRLFGAALVPTHDPAAGAAELRRVATNARFAAAHIFYAMGKPLGHAIYDPVYAAATELDIPLYIHSTTGELGVDSGPAQSGGAVLHHQLEMFATLHHPMVGHLASMIAGGTFERFPGLRLVIAESGLAWLPWMLLELDANYEVMRRDSRWMRQRPIEILRDRLAVSTQPVEASRDTRQRLVDYLSLVDGIEDMICFSSDYPHWDSDEPTFISSIFPDEWHEKLFYGNARRLLRLPAAVPAPA